MALSGVEVGGRVESSPQRVNPSRLLVAFSLAFAFFFVSPAFLGQQFGPYPLMKTGAVVDLLTPVVLLPLYWMLYQAGNGKRPGVAQGAAFLLLAALWVEGQGMHLAANSIGHLMQEMGETDAYALTAFYDERLGHYLWHAGVVGLSSLLIYRGWKHTAAMKRGTIGLISVAGLIYGFTFFLIVIEGATAPLGVPYAALIALLGLTWGRKRLRQQPLLCFFFIAHLAAVVVFAGWAAYWHGLPEFSEVGIID